MVGGNTFPQKGIFELEMNMLHFSYDTPSTVV